MKNTTAGLLIASCCKDTSTPNPCTFDKAYQENCSDALTENIGPILKAIGIVAIIFGAIEVIIIKIDDL